MDADREVQRGHQIVQREREHRWSMNSERLAAIVQELMKPISDLQCSFNLDQSALLETYLTEAGIHMYDGSLDMNAPINFTELALLLQYSTSAYCRKVDLLYDKVLQCSSSLSNINSPQSGDSEEDQCDEEEDATLKSDQNGLDGFTNIKLKPSPLALQDEGCSTPPPTLPRSYIEVGPSAVCEGDMVLTDYEGQPIGLLSDFNSFRPVVKGHLVDQLATPGQRPVPPIELYELQQVIASRAPPPLDDITPSFTPSPPPTPPPTQREEMPPPAPQALARKRKRKYMEPNITDPVKLHISSEKIKGIPVQEFSTLLKWQQNVIKKRSLSILTLRRTLRLEKRHINLPGFGCGHYGSKGFPGWTEGEVSSTSVQCTTLNNSLCLIRLEDSDDDGFFEQSSTHSDCSPNLSIESGLTSASIVSQSTSLDSERLTWQAEVVRRAHEQEAKGCDVTRLAKTVLEAMTKCTHGVRDSGEVENLSISDVIDVDSDSINSEFIDNGTKNPDYGSDIRPFTEILSETVCEPSDVSRMFLTTLFLANAGNVEIVQGNPLSLSSFGVRLLTKEDRLCNSAELLALTEQNRLCNSPELLELPEEDRLCNSPDLLALRKKDRLCTPPDLLALPKKNGFCNSTDHFALTEKDRLCKSPDLLALNKKDCLCNLSEHFDSSSPLHTSNIKRRRR